ncbi:MAG: N-formylglutamate amidohydrolase, partial [Isosphaeraceae bacterium]
APHGGSLNIEGSTERKGMGIDKFVVVRDTYTDRLARAVADALKEKTGKKPHLIIAHFARRHADANRAAAGAYENDSAKRVYDAYHAALAKARDQVNRDFSKGIIIDIHGQGAERETIFRGTQNRSTVKTMLATQGEAAFSGDKSVLGTMVNRGYTIKPDPAMKVPEDARYNGGYITQTYGSKNGGNIDGIQLEFGAIPRSPDQYKKTASDLADALIIYSEAYLGLKTKAAQALVK